MKQTARIISTYSADTFGVCSALFELGGMVVMHDASGCNSTYTTHDEPRWYDMDSMIYISGLSEMEAIMGDDEKLISDIEAAAKELRPKFIAVAGTPIPAMTGFDYTAAAQMIELRTGIPAFGFATTGMNTYVHGASMALEGIARRFCDRNAERTEGPSVNILGLTPLDFSVNGAAESIEAFLKEAGFEVISRWAMGSSLEELSQAGRAAVNLVVSSAGLGAAKALSEIFGTPYVIGTPIGEKYQVQIRKCLQLAVESKKETELLKGMDTADGGPRFRKLLAESMLESVRNSWTSCLPEKEIAVIGEAVTSLSLAQAIELTYHKGVKLIYTTECDAAIVREDDVYAPDEEEIMEALQGMKLVIADPLYRPICPENAEFLSLPAENFSGRIYREEIPNLITGFEQYFGQLAD